MQDLTKKIAVVFLALILSLCVLFVYQSWQGIKIETSVMTLFPSHINHKKMDTALDLLTQKANQQVFFVIDAPSSNIAILAADAFTQKLRSSSLFSILDETSEKKTQKEWRDFLFPYRLQLLTDEQRQLLEENKSASIVITTDSNAKDDPFLLFSHYISSLDTDKGKFLPESGYWLLKQRDSAYILLTAQVNEKCQKIR